MTQVSDIIVYWDAQDSGQVQTIQIQSRVVNTTQWTEQAANFDPSAGVFRFQSNAPASDVEVRLRYRALSGVFGEWESATIRSAGVAVAYDKLTGKPTSLTEISPGEGGKLGGIAPGADVTGNNTSKDTAAVGGVPSSTLINNVNAALANQYDAQGNLIIVRDIKAAIDAAQGRIDAANGRIDTATTDITTAKNAAEAARLVGTNAQQDVGALSTSVNTRFDGVNSYASGLSDRITTVSNSTSAIATRTTTLEASSSPSGGNLVPNSSLSTLDGWLLSFNASNLSSMTLNAAGPTWQIGGVENNLTLYRGLAGTGLCAEALSPSFAVRAGSYLQGYALASSHRSQGWVSIFYYDTGGSMVGYSGENLNPDINLGGQSINAQTITGNKSHQVPANAVYARLSLRLYNVSNDGYAWFARPFVTEVKATTSEWAPYSAGNDRTVTGAANARISAVETVTTNGTFATAQRATNLETSVSGLTGRLSTVETATTDGRFATAQRATNIETSVNGLNGRLSTVETATTDGRFATAQRATNIETTVNGYSGRISNVETATTDGRFAAASTLNQLRSEFNGTAATVTQNAGTITGLQNRTTAFWQVQSVANGNRAQMTVYADANAGAGVDIVGDVAITGSNGGGRTVIRGSGIEIFDGNNTRRVRLGI